MNDRLHTPCTLDLPPDSWARMEMLRAMHQRRHSDPTHGPFAGFPSSAVVDPDCGQGGDRHPVPEIGAHRRSDERNAGPHEPDWFAHDARLRRSTQSVPQPNGIPFTEGM